MISESNGRYSLSDRPHLVVSLSPHDPSSSEPARPPVVSCEMELAPGLEADDAHTHTWAVKALLDCRKVSISTAWAVCAFLISSHSLA